MASRLGAIVNHTHIKQQMQSSLSVCEAEAKHAKLLQDVFKVIEKMEHENSSLFTNLHMLKQEVLDLMIHKVNLSLELASLKQEKVCNLSLVSELDAYKQEVLGLESQNAAELLELKAHLDAPKREVLEAKVTMDTLVAELDALKLEVL